MLSSNLSISLDHNGALSPCQHQGNSICGSRAVWLTAILNIAFSAKYGAGNVSG